MKHAPLCSGTHGPDELCRVSSSLAGAPVSSKGYGRSPDQSQSVMAPLVDALEGLQASITQAQAACAHALEVLAQLKQDEDAAIRERNRRWWDNYMSGAGNTWNFR